VAAAKKLEEQQAKQSKTLLNEHLVTAIMQNTNNNFASDVQVRVSPDPLESLEEGEAKKVSQIMTLDEAIQIAVAEQKDLIAIAIQQDIPVLTISSWESLQYKAEKLSKERRRNASVAQTGASILKEITLKVGIADHDLQRKVDDMIKFLSKGHNCQIDVKAPKRYAIKNPAAAREMADRVVDLMEDNGGELVRDVVMNEEQTQAKFLIRPRKL
jgi:translation initiation factor IF-3